MAKRARRRYCIYKGSYTGSYTKRKRRRIRCYRTKKSAERFMRILHRKHPGKQVTLERVY